MNQISLLTPSTSFKPSRYPWAMALWRKQQQIHWMPEEVALGEDIKDWENNLTPPEKNLLTQLFRFFTQADLDIQDNYMERYAAVFKPHEVKMMLAAFANSETIHVTSYALVLETVGMPDSEFEAFMGYKAMKDKHDYMSKANMDSHHDIAKTLAIFGAFGEGLQLFASFSMLLNFPRFNKMKGMGQIVSWSIRDECYSDDTELLTNSGWKLFKDLSLNDTVAQYDQDTKEISFVSPYNYTKFHYTGDMCAYKTEKCAFDFLVTPNHRMLTTDGIDCKVQEAKDLKSHYRVKLPVSGFSQVEGEGLSPTDRLLIAFQADGSMPKGSNRSGELCGYRRCQISLSRPRKIKRLNKILAASKHNYWVADGGKPVYHIDFPFGQVTKSFRDWVALDTRSAKWCDQFMQELVEWDGHRKTESRFYYSSTVKENVDCVQAIAALAGYCTSYFVQVDNRKETYKDVHRLEYWKAETRPMRTDKQVDLVPYDGLVYCVTVPKSFIVTRRNGRVLISGNSLHAEGIIKLFNTFVEETGCLTEQLKLEIVKACEDIVKMEDAFVDLAFEMGPVRGMTPEDIKGFVRYIADIRLTQLGLEPIYGQTKNPLDWFAGLAFGHEHANFFEARATEYSKATSTGNWEDVWEAFTKRALLLEAT